MSARTCQLCGKPLSRIWVGSGDDFCSREHRNQYRLRKGMDRLLEDNKVATLMRRREQLKPLSASCLVASAQTPRMFSRAQIPTRPRALALFSAAIRIRATAKISPKKERFLRLKSTLPARGAKRPAQEAAGRFHARSSALAVPRREVRMQVDLPRAQLSVLRYAAKGTPGTRREFGILRQQPLRLHLEPGCIQLDPAQSPGTRFNGGTQKAKIVPASGRALRVSSGVGFRVPPLRVAPRTAVLPLPRGLSLHERASLALPASRRFPAAVRTAGQPGDGLMQLPVGSSDLNSRKGGVPAAAFAWPGAVPPPKPRLAAGTVPAARPGGMPWVPNGPMDAFDRRHNGSAARAGFSDSVELRLFTVPPAPVAGAQDPQVGVALFVPQDTPFARPSFALMGTLGGVAATSSQASPPSAAATEHTPAPVVIVPVKLEEHFDTGWGNWLGEMAEWKLDAAGVRTGPLALFVPSLDLKDYDLEFLTRIDNRSVTWVYRAEDFDRYYKATIEAVPGGGFELSHCMVTQGVAEGAVSVPLPKPPGAKKSFPVRTSVRGNEFCVWVDGELVATWTDDRIAAGGIGFIGASDDRARLYWVRLSTTGTPGKEHQV